MTSKPSQAVSYAVIAAKAKELFEVEFSGNPPELRPRWESQPLESREPWLNKAAQRMDADQLSAERSADSQGRKAVISKMESPLEFIECLARMKTDEEMGGEMESDDAIETLNATIRKARELSFEHDWPIPF